MKTCSVCKLEKELVEFHKRKRSSDYRGGVCKECKKIYIRQHYIDNKQYYLDKAKESDARARARIIELKNVPCMDCKNRFPPECMDFDHARGNKSFTIASLISRISIKAILEEIEKCDIVCSNCHRIRTAQRLRTRGAANSAALS
jgi:hypothetical protein